MAIPGESLTRSLEWELLHTILGAPRCLGATERWEDWDECQAVSIFGDADAHWNVESMHALLGIFV